jgi:hypothetical protein
VNDLKGKPFALIGVNTITSDPEKLAAVMAKEQLPWRAVASQEAIKSLWNQPGTPSYYVLDHRGVIRHKWVGNPGAAAIDAALAKLIGEVPDGGKRAGK